MHAMQIPGLIDPVPVPRALPARADGRTAIVGLTRPELIAALVAAGLDPKAAKMRASQVWHWVYHRGVTDFDAMANIAKDTRAAPRRAVRRRAARGGDGAAVGGRDAQVAAALRRR